MNGLRVLVTGANGFLGRPLIERLRETGARICAVSRTLPAGCSGAEWRRGDLTDLEWFQTLVAEVRPEIIYHLASASQGGQDVRLVLPGFENDLRTTLHALLAAQRYGCSRVILLASLEEPVLDGRPLGLSSPYAAAKTCCTMYARLFHQLYGVPVTILRPFMGYGPGQKPHKLIPYAIRSMLDGKAPRLSSGTRLVDWVYVEDIVAALVKAAISPEAVGATIDLGSGTLVAVREVIEQIHGFIPNAPAPEFGGLPDRVQENVRSADTETAFSILGWRAATPLAEGLRKTVDSYAREFSNEKVLA